MAEKKWVSGFNLQNYLQIAGAHFVLQVGNSDKWSVPCVFFFNNIFSKKQDKDVSMMFPATLKNGSKERTKFW